MKITQSQLRQIIKEVIKEVDPLAAAGNKPLMLVAKELEVLLAKIKKALG